MHITPCLCFDAVPPDSYVDENSKLGELDKLHRSTIPSGSNFWKVVLPVVLAVWPKYTESQSCDFSNNSVSLGFKLF